MSEVMDAEAGAGAERRARYEVMIAGADLRFEKYVLTDPVPAGRQVIKAFTREDPTGFIVLKWLRSGMLEELRLDETTRLAGGGDERFIVVASDRSFRIDIAGRRQEWPCGLISGATLKKLGEQDADQVDVFLERQDQPDELIEDDQLVDLSGREVERFHFKPREREVEIFVNRKPVRMTRGEHTGSEIKQAAIDAGINIKPDFVLSLILGPGETRIIGDNDPVLVKKGQRYTAVADDDNS
jgi:hypothetical protein